MSAVQIIDPRLGPSAGSRAMPTPVQPRRLNRHPGPVQEYQRRSRMWLYQIASGSVTEHELVTWSSAVPTA